MLTIAEHNGVTLSYTPAILTQPRAVAVIGDSNYGDDSGGEHGDELHERMLHGAFRLRQRLLGVEDGESDAHEALRRGQGG